VTGDLRYVVTADPIFHVGEQEHTFGSFGSRAPRIGDLVTLKSAEPTDAGHYGDDVAVETWDTRETGAWRISMSVLTKVGADSKPARPVVDEGDLRAVAIGLGYTAEDVETLLTLAAIVTAARAS
jgi:hypothetical protein